MKQVVIYTRVSTEKQAEEGVSLAAQLERAEAWCRYNGHEHPQLFKDAGISGKTIDKRPGLKAALDAACSSKGILVVYSLSRLARSTRDAMDISDRLSKAGADLVSLTEALDTTTATGKMIFRLLAVLAEFERDVISDRTKTALSHKRANGEKTGGFVPYGFLVVGGRLKRDENEQSVIEEIVEMRKLLSLSFRQIARTLNQRGVLTRSGKRWDGKVVGDIYKRRMS